MCMQPKTPRSKIARIIATAVIVLVNLLAVALGIVCVTVFGIALIYGDRYGSRAFPITIICMIIGAAIYFWAIRYIKDDE